MFHTAASKYPEKFQFIDWADRKLGRFENKMRMKQLGGAIYSFKQLLKEFMILGLSKATEDTINAIKEVGGKNFNIWANDELKLRFHHQMRFIRALGNVIKHGNSRIIDNGHLNNNFLIKKCGISDGTDIFYLDFDTKKYIFYTFVFLSCLSSHLTGIPTAFSRWTSEKREYNRFEKYFIPDVFKKL